MACVLLCADQCVVNLGRGLQRVHQRADGSAGIAEQLVHVLTQQSLHQNLSTCHFHEPYLLSK